VDKQLEFENKLQRAIEVEHTVNVMGGLLVLIGFITAYFTRCGWLLVFFGFVVFAGSLVAYTNLCKHQMEGFDDYTNVK